MSQTSTRKRAVVIGGGPVGCLAALALAKQNWSVDLYEGRPGALSLRLTHVCTYSYGVSWLSDLRQPSGKAAAQQRSINLAISHRGIAALDAIDPAVAERFLGASIPMRGRMIHSQSGELDSQIYDRDGQVSSFTSRVLQDQQRYTDNCAHAQCINSIDRAVLNEGLLEEAAASENVRLFFNHKVVSADFDNKKITVQDTVSNREFQVPFDFCIGADGSYSIIRRQMMRVVRCVDFIEHHSSLLSSPRNSSDVRSFQKNGLPARIHHS